eukprot:3498117-Alexandrium_andersonii.AAC.1
MSDQPTKHRYTHSQVVDSMPCNIAEQHTPRLSYAATLYVLTGCTPHAQNNAISKIMGNTAPALGLN